MKQRNKSLATDTCRWHKE